MEKGSIKPGAQPAPTSTGYSGKTLAVIGSTIGVVSGIIGISFGVFCGCKYKDNQLRPRIIDLEAKTRKLEEDISNLQKA